MPVTTLPVHAGLADSSRVASRHRDEEGLLPRHVLLLLGSGVAATLATVFLDFGLRIPGHAILRAVLPMAFGLAVVPRRMAGTVMGVGAVTSALTVQVGGWGSLGFGALTSLSLLGPLLDVALWRAVRGWRLYVGFALAGLGSSMVALAVRGGAKLVGMERLGTRGFAEWWPQAVVTYAICGLLAGLVSALLCFRFSADRPPADGPERNP